MLTIIIVIVLVAVAVGLYLQPSTDEAPVAASTSDIPSISVQVLEGDEQRLEPPKSLSLPDEQMALVRQVFAPELAAE
jgi:hypothetical protein